MYRDSTKALAHRDGKYCAILSCHRDCFTAHNRDKNPAGCLPAGRQAPVTQTPSTAVPLAQMFKLNYMKNYLLLFALTISFNISGQNDTTIYYSEKGNPVKTINEALCYEKLIKVSKVEYYIRNYLKIDDKWQLPTMTKIKWLSDSSYLMLSKEQRIRIYQRLDTGYLIKDFTGNRLIQIGCSKLIFPLIRIGLWKNYNPLSGSLVSENIYRDNQVISNKYWINDSIFIKDTFREVEKIPTYKGGSRAMIAFIKNNLKYPQEAKQKGIEGRVIVRFIVSTEGNVIGTEVINEADSSLAKEAIRIVNLMQKKWTPGKNGNENVSTFMSIPITFKLQ